MPDPTSTPPAVWFVGGFFVLLSLAVYGWQVRYLLREGGRVKVEAFDLPELLMSVVFAGYFAMIIASAMGHHGPAEQAVNIQSVLAGSAMFLIFVAGIGGFMRFRGLRLRALFGLDRVRPLALLGWTAGLMLATFPLAGAATVLTALASHGQFQPQSLVDLYLKVATQHDYGAMSKILVCAVLVAPVCEEFLFRGFFYGVWKRYLGPWSAGFLACLLFAAMHTSLSAFAGLFVLAICLNIAYERTGSLLVPMSMHAMFNLASLLVMFAQAQVSAGQ